MKRRLTSIIAWWGLPIAALLALLWLMPALIRKETNPDGGMLVTNQPAPVSVVVPTPAAPVVASTATPTPTPASVQAPSALTPTPAVVPSPVLPAGANTPSAPPVPLDASPVAAYWQEQYGITAEDIRQTLDRLRAEGVPDHILRDAGAVFVHLPRRNIHAVTIGTLDLPATATAGEPVPYRLTGRLPDASHAFTHLQVTRIDDRLVLQPLGTRSGEPAPGIEVPVELDGALDPLPAGRYRIEYPGQPDTEERFLTVE